MNEGSLVEFNHPHVLLQDTEGYLYKMVQQTGKGECQKLIDVAKSTYFSIPPENRPDLIEKGKEITADDIYLSQEHSDINSVGANHVTKIQDGNNSSSSGVVENMSSSDQSTNSSHEDTEDIDESETSTLLTSKEHQEADQLTHRPTLSEETSVSGENKDQDPILNSASPNEYDSGDIQTSEIPKEDSIEAGETTELLASEKQDD